MDKNALASFFLENIGKTPTGSCFIGFDGFTDEIIHPVDQRENASTYTPFSSIKAFSERLGQAAGKSCNIELVTRQIKLGGNAPIMANALLAAGHPVKFAGLIGKGEIEPLFQPFAHQCNEVFSLGASGHSDALEFPDGKIILGKHTSVLSLTLEELIQTIGAKKLEELFETATLIASVNWTMLPMMNPLFHYILEKICPFLASKKRYFFVDFADPAKRSDQDLLEALKHLKKLNETFEVIVGLNHSEALRLSKLQKLPPFKEDAALAEGLFKALGVSQVLIHTPKGASLSAKNATISLLAPYTEKPFLTTGAGDNFNAGYCSGLLYSLPPEDSLLSALATAGYYVRNGKSPSLEELAIFLRSWDNYP